MRTVAGSIHTMRHEPWFSMQRELAAVQIETPREHVTKHGVLLAPRHHHGASLPLDALPHGLLRPAGRRFADVGCLSLHEMMSIPGHAASPGRSAAPARPT